MYIRICSICGKELKYSYKKSWKLAIKQNSKCKTCSSIGRNKNKTRTTEQKIEMSKRVKGSKNPFYHKTHTEESKQKIREKIQGKTYEELYGDRAQEIKGKIGLKGEKNHLYGTSIYQIWEKKFGEKIANDLSKKWKEKLSIKFSGKNNPMYGKPAPNGSGNGWCGWYKGIFFRSLMELSFIINVIERFKFKWETGEQLKYRIKYLNLKGEERTYHSDFIINNEFMVEIKPRTLWNFKEVLIKKKAGEIWCVKHNLKYKLFEPPKIDLEQLLSLIAENKVILTKRYQKKLITYES